MGRWKKLQADSTILTSTVKRTFTELFYQALPDYIEMGMSVDEFWYGEPILALMYWRANRTRLKRRNQEMYLQGMYNFQAFSRALANIHFDNKHHESVKYLDEPFDILGKTKEEHELEVVKAKEKVKAQLSAWKRNFENK